MTNYDLPTRKVSAAPGGLRRVHVDSFGPLPAPAVAEASKRLATAAELAGGGQKGGRNTGGCFPWRFFLPVEDVPDLLAALDALDAGDVATCDATANQLAGRPLTTTGTVPPDADGPHYFGGSLDGQPVLSPSRSIYRDDDGRPVRAGRGDAEVIHRSNSGRAPWRFYCRDVGGWYVHVTARDDWRARGSQLVQALAWRLATT